MKQLGIKPRTNVDAVIRFVHYRDIVLTAEQEELMNRLQFVDEKQRTRKFDRQQIINAVRSRFGISEWRADQDITDAHRVFGTTRKLNKNYLIAHHLDDIQQQIQLAKNARRLDLLPKLNDNFTYALNSMPPDEQITDTAPVKIVFVVKESTASKTVDDLIAEARKMLDLKPEADEYIEFQDEPGGEDN
jgi:hypothetical protein